MNLDRFTTKAQAAVQEAASLANRNDSGTLEAIHLARTLLDQSQGMITAILQRMEVPSSPLRDELDRAINRLPRVSGDGAQLHPSPNLNRILAKAEAMPDELGDSYVSTEHLLIAILESPDTAAEILKRHGLTARNVREILDDVRGGENVDSQDPEGKMKVLEKYTKDLTRPGTTGAA